MGIGDGFGGHAEYACVTQTAAIAPSMSICHQSTDNRNPCAHDCGENTTPNVSVSVHARNRARRPRARTPREAEESEVSTTDRTRS